MRLRFCEFGLVCAFLCAPSGTQAQDNSCQIESQCSFKKPNILLVLDYSSSMTGFVNAPAWFPPGQTVTTRWLAELDATTWILHYSDGFFANDTRVAISRFAHDPDLDHVGTTIASDKSFPPITDGYAIDLPFDGSDGKYLECKSSGVEAAVEVLRGTPPPPGMLPLDPNLVMLTWTRGALRSAHELITRTRTNHAGDPGESARDYEVVLMTDGDWTCPTMVGQGCDENPAPEAALLHKDAVPVHVVAFGDATRQPSLNEVALQGGTGAAIDATSPQGIVDALSGVLDRIRASVIVPECTAGLPRVMITMDASSSMIAGNMPGATKWDKARFALTGNPAAPNPSDTGYVESVLTRKLDLDGREVAIEDVVHIGLVAFAGANDQVRLANFGPCMRDNIAWAMDPRTSCDAPGCTDPYGGYPITWTFKDSDHDRAPPFVETTHSYMPACNKTQGSQSCVGQIANTFTGQGLRFAHQTISDYKRDASPYHIDDRTRFVNVLITDGQTSQGSSNVRTELEAMVADDIDTYVIGFGSGNELDTNQLNQYAAWGNTKRAIVVDPTQTGGASALADALAGVVAGIGLHACCVLNQCETQPEPPLPEPVCGDGRVEGNEVCDEGAQNATYGHCGGRCDGPHLHCGDRRVDGPEQCDDGNDKDGDGCSAQCMREDNSGVEDESDAGDDEPKVDAGPPRSPVIPDAGPRLRRTTPKKGDAIDAGNEIDAGPAPTLHHDPGCGCRVVGARAGADWLAWFAALLVLLRLGRRRRVSPQS